MDARTRFIEREHWRPRAIHAAVIGLLASVALYAIAAVIALQWQRDFPEQVVVHWGIDGTANRLASIGGFITEMGLWLLMTLALFFALGMFLGRSALHRKLFAAINVYTTGFMSVTLLTTLWSQRGLADVSQSQLDDFGLALALLLPIIPAVLTALVIPKDAPLPATAPIPADAIRMDVPTGQRVVWIHRINPRNAIIALSVVALFLGALAVHLRSWAFAIVPLAFLLAIPIFVMFVIRVDGSGFTASSLFGWPRLHIPLNEIVRASVVHTVPFEDFGGWGWRIALDGTMGIVTRKGQALLVERTGDRELVVTVDDAAGAAALLNTLAAQTR